MPAQSTVEVCPPELLSAADSAAMHLTHAATPQAGAVPTGGGGSSLSDAAAAAIAGEVATKVAQMSAELAADGPAAEATTQAGVAQLEQTDDANAQAILAVGQQGSTTFI
jgi:hypothetical protein